MGKNLIENGRTACKNTKLASKYATFYAFFSYTCAIITYKVLIETNNTKFLCFRAEDIP